MTENWGAAQACTVYTVLAALVNMTSLLFVLYMSELGGVRDEKALSVNGHFESKQDHGKEIPSAEYSR